MYKLIVSYEFMQRQSAKECTSVTYILGIIKDINLNSCQYNWFMIKIYKPLLYDINFLHIFIF